MRPVIPLDVVLRALHPMVDRLAETKVPCPVRACEVEVDALCPLCEGSGLVTIEARAEWLAMHPNSSETPNGSTEGK